MKRYTEIKIKGHKDNGHGYCIVKNCKIIHQKLYILSEKQIEQNFKDIKIMTGNY